METSEARVTAVWLVWPRRLLPRDLPQDMCAAVRQEWRNRLIRSETGRFELRWRPPRGDQDHWLFQADARQQRRRGYRARITAAIRRARASLASCPPTMPCDDTIRRIAAPRVQSAAKPVPRGQIASTATDGPKAATAQLAAQHPLPVGPEGVKGKGEQNVMRNIPPASVAHTDRADVTPLGDGRGIQRRRLPGSP